MPARPVPTRKLAEPNGNGRHIMIVEDNADTREALQELLEGYGFSVHVAHDGEQGVRSTIEKRPEFAVIDIGLPLMDGYEVARRVRAALGPEIFLIALTGYGQDGDRQRASAAGFDAHLAKPAEVVDIVSLLMR